jgi:hypothetical protein
LRGILLPDFILPGSGEDDGEERSRENQARAPVVYPVEAPVPGPSVHIGPFGPPP